MKNTIFSINPATNEQYISVEDATKVISAHINRYGKNVVNRRGNGKEDLIQRILMRLCSLEYKHEKSAPKTFIIRVCMSTLGNVVKENNAYDRHKEVLFISEEQEDINTNKLSTYTPEDLLSAYEQLYLLETEVSYIYDVRDKTSKRSE